ncbi:thermonuclease family protein [Roseomonas sp. HJA6]|uniref:Thermonuclease family protein n=1 Tax=Roseomonas alba TaxID=2846776 RepID=A0ABS7ACE9_9PROT|nr:thermonuclease family protein [Neoroseomonas alba]
MTRASIIAAIAAITLATSAAAQSPLRVIDGDTIEVRGRIVRIIGLDAPEIHGRCPEETRLAIAARDRLAQLLAGRSEIRTRGRDRYGRTLGRVLDANGRDVAQVLISEGLARPYDGRSRRQGWCS